MALKVLPDADAVARAVADRILQDAQGAAHARGAFRIALAGGSSPKPLYRLLAGQRDQVDWSVWQVFFGDERVVPPEDEKSNYRLARETFLDHVPIPPMNVHRIRGELAPAAAAEDYAATLGDQRLDVVLLGMGDDGHTASLFPGSPALDERSTTVVTSVSPVPPKDRVTLTFPVLNAARAVYFVITGEAKAERLAQMLEQRARGEPELPSARVDPADGELVIYADAPAAAKTRTPETTQ